MKILVNSAEYDFDLADILKKIIKIEVVDDVRTTPCILAQMPQNLFASDDINKDPEYDQQEEDMKYLRYDDDALLKLSSDIIHKFQNLDLLIRVGKLKYDLLSTDQQKYLDDTLSQKDRTHNEITDEDINYLLTLIKECNRVDYDLVHDKTNKFAFNAKGDFRERAVLRVLKNLTFSDWIYRTRSINPRYLGNTLFIFDPDVSWVDANNQTRYLRLYVKLDVSNSTKTAIALVSFHEYGDD